MKCWSRKHSIAGMSTAKDRILHDALTLDEHERADVATRLLESLEPADSWDRESIERTWATEIERRCVDLDAGRSSTLAWDDVRRTLQAEILECSLRRQWRGDLHSVAA